MKRLILATSLMLLAIGICTAENIYIHSVFRGIYDDLSAIEHSDAKSELIDSTVNNWEISRKKLSYFIDHDKLDEISLGFLRLKSSVGTENFEFAYSIEYVRFLLDDISGDEDFSMEGVL